MDAAVQSIAASQDNVALPNCARRSQHTSSFKRLEMHTCFQTEGGADTGVGAPVMSLRDEDATHGRKEKAVDTHSRCGVDRLEIRMIYRDFGLRY
jgi:hypothetical protein